MDYKIKWKTSMNTQDNLSFLVIGPAPECLRITKPLKMVLDERFSNTQSLVHSCEDVKEIIDEVNIKIDFIVILIDCTHQRSSQLAVRNNIKNIDPRFLLNSRLVFIKLMAYSRHINKDMSSFVTQLSVKYDSICLTGCIEELEHLNEICRSICQYACYIFQKKFVFLYNT